jgi:hypothetical protein
MYLAVWSVLPAHSYIWANVAVGSYTLFAKATQNLGGITTSAAVDITMLLIQP